MSEIISWPIGPLEGDQYSVNGKFWEWNGCAWISTCCPGVCSIYETGIILGITEDLRWGPGEANSKKRKVTIKICFKHDEQTGTWNSETINPQGDYYQMAYDSNSGAWRLFLMSLGVPIDILGEISTGNTPIGEWKWRVIGQKAESICGCPPMICGCTLENSTADCKYVSFYPISLTGVSGDTVGYIDIYRKYVIYYNTTTLQWEFWPIDWTNSFATISLPITTVPIGPDIGDWTLTPTGDEKFYAFSTTVGHCESCNPYTDGIIFAYTVEGLTTYVPLTWNATTDQFENFDGSIYIEYNGADLEWNLWINGTLVYSHTSPNKGEVPDLLGFWKKEITILCGSTTVTNTEGCLVAVSGGENAATLYLQENTFGEFNYGYPFSQPTWQIVCDGGVWNIQEWDDQTSTWVTQAYVTAVCTTPPYSLTWTVSPTSDYDSFTFTAGPCPVVCNSYSFRSISPDGSEVSFKLCECDQVFTISLSVGEISPVYCVQEDSINLGAFGAKQPEDTPCTPNPTQCYTISIRNTSAQQSATISYIDCSGDTIEEDIAPDSGLTRCMRACSLIVLDGSIYPIIEGLGCL
jgi:hypothetical protein